jgi:hypothetical protein
MNLTWERWRPAGVSDSQKQQPAGETPALPDQVHGPDARF